MKEIQGMLFFFLLLYASFKDIKSREVSNFVPIYIFLIGFLDISFQEVPLKLLAALLITLPQLIVAIHTPGSYGGADIKIMASCTFILGLWGGITALILGLSIGLFATVVKRKLMKQSLNEKFPVVPSLAIGSMLTYLFI